MVLTNAKNVPFREFTFECQRPGQIHTPALFYSERKQTVFTSPLLAREINLPRPRSHVIFLSEFPCLSLMPPPNTHTHTHTLYSQLPESAALRTISPGHLMTLSLRLPALESLSPGRTVCRAPLLTVPLVPAWGLGTHCVLPRHWRN